MPSLTLLTVSSLDAGFDKPTRPYVVCHLGKTKLGKSSILFENRTEGEWGWLEDDDTRVFTFTKTDLDHLDSETDDSDSEYSKESSSSTLSPSSPSSTISSPTGSDSSVSTQTSASSTVRMEICLSVYHSQSHRKSKFLGHCIVPIHEILQLDPGVILKISLPLQPKRGQSHKHVGGQITFNLQSGSIHELLSKILQTSSNADFTDILKKSITNRTRNSKMSEKVDSLLDTHWNKLESKAASRVDKQLIDKGLVTIVEPKMKVMSYIEQVMTGVNAYTKKRRSKETEEKEEEIEIINSRKEEITKVMTPAEARRSRLVQAGARLQLLNKGIKERKEAEWQAEKLGNKMKSWLVFNEENPAKNKPYPLTSGVGTLSKFGVAVSLHFRLITWLQRLCLVIGSAGIYLTFLCWESYVKYESSYTSSDLSPLLRISVLSFKESSDGVSTLYAWIVSAQTVVTVIGMTLIRVLVRRETQRVEDATETSADYAVEVSGLPRKFLSGDPSQHTLKKEDSKKAHFRHKKHHHKHKKKKKKKYDSEDEQEQELTAQDVSDHFSQFGPVVHVALSFDVKKFWDLVHARNAIKERIERVHQQRSVKVTAGGEIKQRTKAVGKLEKKLNGIYKELAICNKKIRRMDMGQNYDPAMDSNIEIPTGCCTFDKSSNHRFKTTGKAYVMFRYKKDADLCISQLNKNPRAFLGLNYSVAGNNIKRIMRDSKHKASNWVQNISIRRPTEPQDIIWKNLEYDMGDRRLRNFLMWGVILPLVLIGFFITCTVSLLKLKINKQCVADSTVEDVSIVPILNTLIDQIYSDSTSSEWFCDNGLVYIITGLTSILISLINLLLSKLVIYLTVKLERSHLKSSIQGKVVLRVSLVQYFNTCVSLLVTYNAPQAWSEEGNLVDSALLFVMLSITQPLVNLFMKTKWYPFVQGLKRRRAMTTKELNDTFMPPPYEIERRYATVVCTFMTSVFFLPLVPLTPIIAWLALLVAYQADKYLLLRTSNSKALLYLGSHGAEMAVAFCAPIIIITSVTGFLIMSATYHSSSDTESFLKGLEQEAIKPYSIVVWVVVLLHISLPFWRGPVISWLETRRDELKQDVEDGRFSCMNMCSCCPRFLCCRKCCKDPESGERGEGENLSSNDKENDEKDEAPGRRQRRSTKQEELESLTSRKAKKQIGQQSGDFFYDPRILNVVRHYQAPTPTCMLQYQVMHPQYLPNHTVDATIILDPSDNGQMTSEDFKNALEMLGVHLKENQAAAIVELYDTDGDGFVSTAEFMDAASRYVDEDGNVDFYAFAYGVVRELEEEFGHIHDFDSQSSTSDDTDSDWEGGHRFRRSLRRGRSGDSERGRGDIETPPVPTEDVLELETLISKKWKIEHHEKEGTTHQLTWEDYEGTGIRRPKHIQHIYAGMSARDRAKIAYVTGQSPNKFTGKLALGSVPENIMTPRKLTPRGGDLEMTSPLSPSRMSMTSSVTHEGLSPSRSRGTLTPPRGSAFSPALSSPGRGSPGKTTTPNTSPGKETKYRGYWEDGKYVSAAEHKIQAEEALAVNQLLSGSGINISEEADDIYYHTSRRDSMDNTLSASLLNLSSQVGREVSAAGISDSVAVENLVNLQQPGGYWKLNAALCVQIKCQLRSSLSAKPGGCEKELWATFIVLEFFERYCPRLGSLWQLSAKIANKWIEKRAHEEGVGEGAIVSKRFDEAVRKRARKFLKHELIDDDLVGWVNYDDSSDEGGGEENDGGVGNVKVPSKGKAWSSNSVKRKPTAEDEHRKKLQIQQWKKSSFEILARMTGKQRHENPLDDFFLIGSDSEDENVGEERVGGREEGVRRSVQFDSVVETNEGEKFGAMLPPVGSSTAIHRHAKSGFSMVEEKSVFEAYRKGLEKVVSIQSLGLKCSVGAHKNRYVQIKPLCARHFILRTPPAVPGAGDGGGEKLNPKLVCVGMFGKAESDPISICTGGAPPGYKPDVLRVHYSPQFSVVRFGLFQIPNICIGGATIELRNRIGDLTKEDKMYVLDIVGPDGEAGGYFGQFAVMMKLVTGAPGGGVEVKKVKEEKIEQAKVRARKSVKETLKILKAASSFSNAAKKMVLEKEEEVKAEKEEEDLAEEVKVEKTGLEVNSDDLVVARIVQNNVIPDSMVTKMYNIDIVVGEEKRKRLTWDAVASGTYKVISTCPQVIVPLQDRICIAIGEGGEQVIRLLFLANKHAMTMQAGIIIQREGDGRICECLKFALEYKDA